MTWNRPTAFEFMNDLLGMAGRCVVCELELLENDRLRLNIISKALNKATTELSLENNDDYQVNKVEFNQDGANQAGFYDYDLESAISSNQQSSGELTVRTEDAPILDTGGNGSLILPYEMK